MSHEWFTFLKQEMFFSDGDPKKPCGANLAGKPSCKNHYQQKTQPKIYGWSTYPPKRTPLRKQGLIAGVINGNQWLINRE